jgi:DNA (cytosine-5)-methyltransferase 1
VPPGFLVETAQTSDPKRPPRGLDEALPSQTAQRTAALVGLPFILSAGSNVTPNRPVDEAMPTHTATERLGLAIPPATMVAARNNNVPQTLADPLHVVCTGGHHMLVTGAALINLRGEASRQGGARGLDGPLATQVASSAQDWLVTPPPFFTGYYGTGGASPVDGPLPTVTTLDRHALIGPDEALRIEDCYFRMLQPVEIGAGMAFPRNYRVMGNKRDQVKQYGNAVTPPAMAWLTSCVVASLYPEKAA